VNSDNVPISRVDTTLAPGDVVTILPRFRRLRWRIDHFSPSAQKGVFVAYREAEAQLALHGPFGPGIPVYSTLIDTRGTPRLYASSCNPFFGMKCCVR